MSTPATTYAQWRKRALAAEADRDWLREALRALAEEEKARHIVNTKQGDVNGI